VGYQERGGILWGGVHFLATAIEKKREKENREDGWLVFGNTGSNKKRGGEERLYDVSLMLYEGLEREGKRREKKGSKDGSLTAVRPGEEMGVTASIADLVPRRKEKGGKEEE